MLAFANPTPRFANIPNILQGKSLCGVIKTWREQQQLFDGGLSTGVINWDEISDNLNAMGDGDSGSGSGSDSSSSCSGGNSDAHLSPSACEILWKYLAYGQVVTENDLLGGAPLSTSFGSGVSERVSIQDMIMGSSTKTFQKRQGKTLSTSKQSNMWKVPNSLGLKTSIVVKQVKKRPGTIYVPCEYCQKDISHSNIAAHVRKAHPEYAKQKKERIKKSPPSAKTSTTMTSSTTSSSSTGQHKGVTPAQAHALSNSDSASSRCACMYCHGDFSRSHISKHVKKMHPVESVLEALVKRVVFETDFFQPFEPSTSSSTAVQQPVPPAPTQAPMPLLSNSAFDFKWSSLTFPCAVPPSSFPPATSANSSVSMKPFESQRLYHTEGDGDRGFSSSLALSNTCNYFSNGGFAEEGAERSESEGQRKARQRREATTVTCQYCNVTITKKHMIVHIRKLHPEMICAGDEDEAMTECGAVRDASTDCLTAPPKHARGPIPLASASAPKERTDKLPTVACKHCGKEITKKSIRAHVRNLHPGKGGQGDLSGGDGGPARPTVSCPTTQCTYCLKVITKKSIRAHVRNLHPEAAVGEVLAAASAASAAAAAAAAGLVAKGQSNVANKSSMHGSSTAPSAAVYSPARNCKLQTVICQYCLVRVPKTELWNHVRTSHERTVTSPCKYCPKNIQNRNMNTHVRKYHIVESVVEVLVSKVVSVTETQPVVAPVDCCLPGSRLIALNNMTRGSTTGSVAVTGSKPLLPFSTQRELDEYDAQLLEENSEDKSVSHDYDKAVGTTKMIKEYFNDKETVKRKLPAAPENIAVATKKHRTNFYVTSIPDELQSETLVPDYSNLDLLATFASTLLPIP